MQTAETLNEGLKRGYKLTIPAKDIAARVDAQLKQVAPQVRMPGFRPGKVPANLVRKMHGPAIEQEALNSAVQESVQQLLAEQKLRPAIQPSVELAEGYEAGRDAELAVSLEILPDVPEPKIEGLKVERLTAEPTDAEVDAAVERLATQQKSFEPAAKSHKAALGDLVVMGFEGKVDGEPFDGGKGEDMQIELGSGRLIPGFEDQLVGVKANDEKTVKVTFPDDYNVAYLKGKPAEFSVVINEVRTPKTAKADEEFAKSLGLEGLDKLKELFREQIAQELNGLTRTHMKRKLLDQLAAAHDFDVPPTMVEAEFDQIWQQLQHEVSHEADPEAAKQQLEGERDEYRAIAVRRVRLGLLLSEIGQTNGIEITQQEMNRLISQAAQQYRPEQRQQFVRYVQENPMAAAQLRAPLFEEKVVDFLLDKAEVTDCKATREELEAAIEAEDEETGHVHGPGCGHDHAKPAAKKPAAKKAAPKAEAEKAEKAEKPAAKKAAPKKAAAEPAAKKAPAKGAKKASSDA